MTRGDTDSGASGAPAANSLTYRAAGVDTDAAGALVEAQSAGSRVLHLTGQMRPSLVDRATYQGKPAYVIAVTNWAWVVGTGCTATNPELIASVGL